VSIGCESSIVVNCSCNDRAAELCQSFLKQAWQLLLQLSKLLGYVAALDSQLCTFLQTAQMDSTAHALLHP